MNLWMCVMAVELSNAEGLYKPTSYVHVGVATGSRTVYLAGQVARNAEGDIVGRGDLAAQVEFAYLNVAKALRSVGASFDDIAKLTLYVVDWHSDKMPVLREGVHQAARQLGIDPLKPGTLIGVAALSDPELLVEVDAVAVLP
jgi:enamine deaminase RidA (YjgF/YER057c/UK114 family)